MPTSRITPRTIDRRRTSMTAPFGMWRTSGILRQRRPVLSPASRRREDSAKQALHQINVVGEHREQLVAIEPQRAAVPGHRRAPPRRSAGERVGHADGCPGRRSMGAAPGVPGRPRPGNLIDGRRRARRRRARLPAVSGTSGATAVSASSCAAVAATAAGPDAGNVRRCAAPGGGAIGRQLEAAP